MARLITNLTQFAFRQAWLAVSLSTPWVIRFLIFAAGVSVRLSIIAIWAVVRGVDTAARETAREWQMRAVAGGFPSIWERHLYNVFYVLAICTIFAGWMMIAFTGILVAVVSVNVIF